MPHNANSSSTNTAAAKRAQKKEIMFGSVQVIPDTPASPSLSSSSSSSLSSSAIGGYKLRRSPTPVLTSLTELTNAHLFQLSSVWQETSVPSFEQDKSEIAASMSDKRDPFDF